VLAKNDKIATFGARKCCAGAFFRGLFLAIGGIVSPKKGYRLEFFLETTKYAKQVAGFLNSQIDANASTTTFRGSPIVYVFTAEGVKDTLLLMGASNCVLAFENVRIVKATRAKVNRLENFANANLDKSLASTRKFVLAVKNKQKEDPSFLYCLDKDSLKVVKLRLEYQEASIRELADILSKERGEKIPVGFINYRLQKIRKAFL
jgi:DNA-binding protein WhiA